MNPEVTLYHGTNSYLLQKAQQTGELLPRKDLKDVVSDIAKELKIYPDSLWNGENLLQSPFRGSQHTTAHDFVFLTPLFSVALDFAHAGLFLHQILHSANKALHPGSSLYSNKEFAREWIQKHSVRPVVLTLTVPLEVIPQNADSGEELPDSIHFLKPIPLAWVIEEKELLKLLTGWGAND